MNKQIEDISCKDCLHYEVCMYVNAKAVEFARAENCKLFADKNGYRKTEDVAREIFAEIDKFTVRYINDADYTIGDMILDIIDLKKKYESEGEE